MGVVSLSNTAQQVSLAPHSPELVAVPHSALYYMKFTAKHLEGIGLLAVFLLDFIRPSDVKWQQMKQSISFETATSVLKHQGQCLAHNKAVYIEPGPACAHVPHVWHCALCFPSLGRVPPTANRTGLLWR